MFWDVLKDAAIDSAKVLAVLLPITILIALLEPRLAGKVKLSGRVAPLVGVSVGLFPQCGFSVVATDLYQKRHITVGTLMGVYLATSDEALPIFLADPDKALHIMPADAICVRGRREVEAYNAECGHVPEVHLGCCSHSIESGGDIPDYGTSQHTEHEHKHAENEHGREKSGNFGERTDSEREDKAERTKRRVSQYLVHPLVHSLKIFAYVLAVNILFGALIAAVGEDALIGFLSANKYVAPLVAVVVGAIPNCASSVVISNLYLLGGLGFGATLGGLLMNAGIGFAVLFKDKAHLKRSAAIFGAMFAVSVAFGYIVSAIFSFGELPL